MTVALYPGLLFDTTSTYCESHDLFHSICTLLELHNIFSCGRQTLELLAVPSWIAWNLSEALFTLALVLYSQGLAFILLSDKNCIYTSWSFPLTRYAFSSIVRERMVHTRVTLELSLLS